MCAAQCDRGQHRLGFGQCGEVQGAGSASATTSFATSGNPFYNTSGSANWPAAQWVHPPTRTAVFSVGGPPDALLAELSAASQQNHGTNAGKGLAALEAGKDLAK
jgi:hypothetical protein